MARLHVQFQPRRASQLRLAAIADLMLAVSISSKAEEFSMTRGKGNEYVNFDFKTPTVAVVWRDLQKTVLNHRRFGRLARRATIIARTGSRGWNNYKLLHHFDPSVPLDT